MANFNGREFHVDNVDFHAQGYHWWACGPTGRFINPLDIVCEAYLGATNKIDTLTKELEKLKAAHEELRMEYKEICEKLTDARFSSDYY